MAIRFRVRSLFLAVAALLAFPVLTSATEIHLVVSEGTSYATTYYRSVYGEATGDGVTAVNTGGGYGGGLGYFPNPVTGPTVRQSGDTSTSFTLTDFDITCLVAPCSVSAVVTGAWEPTWDISSVALAVDGSAFLSPDNPAHDITVHFGFSVTDTAWFYWWNTWFDRKYTRSWDSSQTLSRSGRFLLRPQMTDPTTSGGWDGIPPRIEHSFQFYLNVSGMLPGDTFVLPDSMTIDVRPAETSTVPEPASMLLLGTGLVGAVGAARRRMRR